MKSVKIGKILGTGKALMLDIPALLKSRLLVQASSGGGKTYAIRKIIEETHGHVQQIILDVEDDFSTLREQFPFVLVGKGGDIAADPRSAELLAKKVLELQADVIINLYELKQHERIRFVKVFLSAMVDAPKELWHPCIVVLDEAHMFAPEKAKAESLSAVIDMASRGRKRGFCLIPATQRPAKLHKDVTAECQNKMIGLANQDIDRKRGAEELGFTDKKGVLSLRDLKEGEFFVVGPAFGRGVMKILTDKVKTTHHEAGKIFKRSNKTVAPKKVQSILAKLTDLPKEAEEELKDKASMTLRIRELERELKKMQQNTPKAEIKVQVEKIVDPKAVKAEIKNFKRFLIKNMDKSMQDFQKAIMSNFDPAEIDMAFSMKDKTVADSPVRKPVRKEPVQLLKRVANPYMPQQRESKIATTDSSFGKCERAILKFLAVREGSFFNKVQIGAMTNYSPGSGGFNNALSKLSQSGLIDRSNDKITLASCSINEVRSILGSDYAAPEPDALLAWLNKLGKCERTIFETVKTEDRLFTKDELGQVTGYSSGSGGFNNALSKLSTLGLIKRNNDGTIGLNQELVNI